jgi:hypothetical protein
MIASFTPTHFGSALVDIAWRTAAALAILFLIHLVAGKISEMLRGFREGIDEFRRNG